MLINTLKTIKHLSLLESNQNFIIDVIIVLSSILLFAIQQIIIYTSKEKQVQNTKTTFLQNFLTQIIDINKDIIQFEETLSNVQSQLKLMREKFSFINFDKYTWWKK